LVLGEPPQKKTLLCSVFFAPSGYPLQPRFSLRRGRVPLRGDARPCVAAACRFAATHGRASRPRAASRRRTAVRRYEKKRRVRCYPSRLLARFYKI
jgi:hypothetical protein